MAQDSILDILPFDILDLVIGESKKLDPKEYSNLRLVCKDINDIVEPQLLSTVTIGFTRLNFDALGDKIQNLASGIGPHARCTKSLRINGLIPSAGDFRLNLGKDRDRMLGIQSQWLVPAIKGLPRIETAEFHVNNCWEPYHDVLFALAELPRLQRISFNLYHTSPDVAYIPLERFSNLQAINLKYLHVSPSFIEGTRGMIANSPSLAELDIQIHCQDWSESADLELGVLFETAIHSPRFKPTLRTLSISQEHLSLTASCTPFLLSLTHLDLRDYSSRAHSSFWVALQYAGIALRSLSVSPINRYIADYLLSYTGLEKLSLSWPAGAVTQPAENNGIDCVFFDSILPQHRRTLKALSFDHQNPSVNPWCITTPRLRQLMLCEALVDLDLLYYCPSPRAIERVSLPTVSLNDLLSDIARHLPQLWKLNLLILVPVYKFDLGTIGFVSRSGCRKTEPDALYISLLCLFSTVTFHSERPPQFEISAGQHVLRPTPSTVRGQWECRKVHDT